MKQASPISSISRRLWDIYAEERLLFCVGLMGIVLGLIGLVAMAVYGRIIPPEGFLYKAVSFDMAIGIYVLTIILLMPLAGLSARARIRWRWWSVAMTVYVYGAENIQIYRGMDPRFTRVGSLWDQIAGAILGAVAVGLIVMFLILVWRFFSKRTFLNESLLLVGIRYGCTAVILAFAAGIWMGAIQGPMVETKGNVLPLHAAGFHGLQAVPLVALMLGGSSMSRENARRLVHVAGIAWLCFCAAIAWQTAQGRSVLEASPATVLAASFFAVWIGCAVAAALTWRRAGWVLNSA